MEIYLSRSDDIFVFGSGTIASLCVEYLRKETQGCIYVFEKKENSISALKKRVTALENTCYSVIEDGIEETILRMRPKVIFSIGNTYIFREPLVDFCPIINYHNALLPKHAGRNAEAWAIFSQDRETGVTWHCVERAVDAGDIIMQRAISLTTSMTSIELLSLQTRLAFDMFQEIAKNIIAGRKLLLRCQEYSGDIISYHYSWDRPNNGILDRNWDFAMTSAFLRAMDYGRLSLLGRPVFFAGNSCYTWRKYSIRPDELQLKEFIDLNRERCIIAKKGGIIELQGLEII